MVDAAHTFLMNSAWYLAFEAEHCSNVEKRVPLIHTTGRPVCGGGGYLGVGDSA